MNDTPGSVGAAAELLRIGELARRAHVPTDTLRYYDRLGLVEPARRSATGYRLYGPAALERLSFVRKAQALGLSLEEVGEVLRAADDGVSPCTHVRQTLQLRVRDVDDRIAELRALKRTMLSALERADADPGAGRCVCGIIEGQELPGEVETRPIIRSKEEET